ncbi:hypothetical protein [Streptomyces sp. NPDC089799]|uniref:hypothetical protein n=1 Tax=Streptomyces sp. NPDC089799 TaxID=3155066 RepID=UPI0034375E30
MQNISDGRSHEPAGNGGSVPHSAPLGVPAPYPGSGWPAAGYAPGSAPDHDSELRSLREAVAALRVRSEAVADHETRLRALESRSWPLPVIVALTSLGAVLVAFAALFLTK